MSGYTITLDAFEEKTIISVLLVFMLLIVYLALIHDLRIFGLFFSFSSYLKLVRIFYVIRVYIPLSFSIYLIMKTEFVLMDLLKL